MNADNPIFPRTIPTAGDNILWPFDVPAAAPSRVTSDTIARHADHPSGYLVTNPGMCHFTSKGCDGFIAYRAFGNVLFQFGGVFAPRARQAVLLERFRVHARDAGKRICAVQLRPGDVPLYEQAGFCINQLGSSYTLDLATFRTAGTRFMKMRNKIARARKSGITVAELGVDTPRDAAAWEPLQAITARWLRTKGRFAKLMEFMIGELGGPDDRARRIFVGYHEGRVVAFISYVPSYGELAGMMHDLSRRDPDAPPGVMELINVTALERFQQEGIRHLNFGLTPFTGLSNDADCAAGRSRACSWLVRMLARHGAAIYPAESQAQYKLKWNPQIIVPEYVAFEGRFRWSMAWRLLLLTRAI